MPTRAPLCGLIGLQDSYELDEEPYASSEILKNSLESQLQKDLDYDFVQYCIEDDYYPPVPEDYDDNFREDVLKPFCEKYGLECVFMSPGQGEGGQIRIFRN